MELLYLIFTHKTLIALSVTRFYSTNVKSTSIWGVAGVNFGRCSCLAVSVCVRGTVQFLNYDGRGLSYFVLPHCSVFKLLFFI